MTAPGPSLPQGARTIRLALVAFIVTCALLFVVGSRLKPLRESDPGFPIAERAQAQPDGTFLVTLDVKSRDHWVPFNFAAGRVVPTEQQADILARRSVLRAPKGAKNLGTIELADAQTTDSGWVYDERVDDALKNTSLSDWYDYSQMTHLLHSKKDTFAVRRGDSSGVVFLQMHSYYCEPDGSACLTLRYRLAAPEELGSSTASPEEDE
ncbi:MAG TPA: hypothetical protein DIU15_06295 [Deltaproteobacteria bacterium]|nr:hypothetical protein [Deltaproteobacteria bacterium]HCP45630.1 hypothetical protein [Deltaproteobacteria bacterium]